MRAADARALETVPLAALVERAGTAAARSALGLLGAAYGRRVVVVAGKGHNGDDGRVVARILARRGAKVAVVDARSTSTPFTPVNAAPVASVKMLLETLTPFARSEYLTPTTPAP